MKEEKLQKISIKYKAYFIWIVIVILLFAIYVIIYDMYEATSSVSKSVAIISLIMIILILIIFLLFGVTKYKEEFLLTDPEKEKKWNSLSRGFKIFYRNLIIYEMVVDICLVVLGLYTAFDPITNQINYASISMAFVGLIFFITAIIRLKKTNVSLRIK